MRLQVRLLAGPLAGALVLVVPATRPAAAPAAAPAAEAPPLDRYLQMRSAGAPSPSPDGKEVAFLTNVTGVNQAWRVAAAGGWPHQVSFFVDRVRGVWWSPRGDRIAFTVDEGGKERLQIWVASPDGSRPKRVTERADRIHGFGGWSPDGRTIAFTSNARDERYFDVYTVDVETGATKRVKQADELLQPGPFSPDGKWLLFGRWRTLTDGDVYVRELATGRELHLNPHEKEAQLVSVEWAADSSAVLLTTDAGSRDNVGLARVSLEKPGTLAFVYTPPWDVEGIAASPKTVAVTVNEDGYGRVRLLDASSFAPVEGPAIPDGVPGGLEFSLDGSALFFSFSGPRDNGDVFRLELADRKLTRVTDSDAAGIDETTLVAPKLVRFPSHDGTKIPGFLYLPAGANGPVPLVVSIHGGPESQERPAFNAVYQYLLSRGIGVYAPNIRGSTGYGAAFLRADNGVRRKAAIADVQAAAEHLVKTGVTRRGAIGIMGASYGGYMSLAQLAFHPQTFAAGVAIVGIVNFETFLEGTDAFRRPLREKEYGSLAKDRAVLKELSPVHKVEAIRAPLLVVHGENDPRVPVAEARQVVERIQKRGGQVEAVYFADEGHGLAKLKNRIAGYTRVAEFLEKNLRVDAKSR